MHAGLARNSRDQRAHAAKFPAITVETIMPAEKRHEKCTPARRAVSRQDDPFPDTLLVFVEINMDRF
ncbi:MAG: hypothetical protein ACLTA1_03885 [Clostridia bacterium]